MTSLASEAMTAIAGLMLAGFLLGAFFVCGGMFVARLARPKR